MRTPVIAATMVSLLALAAQARQSPPSPYEAADGAVAISEAIRDARGPWRATDLINRPVFNAAGRQIGSVNDFTLDEMGKPSSLVIGVGGFLGIGERQLTLPIQYARRVVQADGTSLIRVDASWDASLPPDAHAGL